MQEFFKPLYHLFVTLRIEQLHLQDEDKVAETPLCVDAVQLDKQQTICDTNYMSFSYYCLSSQNQKAIQVKLKLPAVSCSAAVIERVRALLMSLTEIELPPSCAGLKPPKVEMARRGV